MVIATGEEFDRLAAGLEALDRKDSPTPEEEAVDYDNTH
jgi:hypothetical protein